MCSLCCVCCLVCVCWVFRLCSVPVVSVCYPLLCVCSLMCVYCMCLICVACICYWSVCLCVSLCLCLLTVVCLLCLCVPVSVSCMPVFYMCVCLCVCMSVFLISCVCILALCLCCWLPCWCGVYHGGVMGACFWVWWFWFFGGCGVCGFFLFFYSRFLVGGRLLLGFCYRTFFCGFPWGLCRARNFFKDITHSYCGFVSPVMSLYMPLLAYLYHTLYCVDTAPVSCLCPCLSLLVLYLCFVLCCPDIAPTCACIMF